MSDIVRFRTDARMSMASVHGGVAYLSGQIALKSVGADVTVQTREVLGQIDAILAEVDSGRDRILSASVWLTDLAHFAAMNAEWEAWLPAGCAPARATVISGLALEGLSVEIAVIAAVR